MGELIRLGTGGVVPVRWQVEKSDNGPGKLSGYASVFNVVDAQEDVVKPGAFTDSIKWWKSSGQQLPMMADHSASTDRVIGSFDSLREDAHGLAVAGPFARDPVAQEVRQKMKDRHVGGLSIFGDIIKASAETVNGRPVRALEQLHLLHIAVTPMPALKEAFGVAKSHDGSNDDPVIDGPWDESATLGRLADTAGSDVYAVMFAGARPGTDAAVKASWLLAHHHVDEYGRVGAANLTAVKAALAAVDGAAMDEAGKAAARAHLQRHVDTFAKAQSLDTQWVEDMRAALSISSPAAQRAAVDLLVKSYGDVSGVPLLTPPAQPPTAPPPAAPAANDAAKYALAVIGEVGPVGKSADPTDEAINRLLGSVTAPHIAATLSDLDEIEAALTGQKGPGNS